MWTQVGSGNNSNLETTKSYEDAMDEGQRGRLVINFQIPVPDWQISYLRDSLNFAGVEDLEIDSSGNQVTITWRKGFAWVPVIILAVIALAIIIVSWQFFKEVSNSSPILQLGTTTIVILVLVIVGAIFILPYFLTKKGSSL